jgi:glucose-6-phosphate 1-dehydrogenase
MIQTLLLLGLTGDLAKRFLLPAVGALAAADRLPEDFTVIGAARGALEDESLERIVAEATPFGRFSYRPVDVGDPSSLAAALEGAPAPAAVYLALPPSLFATTIESLGEVGLPPGSRVAVEKPFGDDLDSARALNALLAETGMDSYRVDHVLGMETVQNLVAMRGANPVFDRVCSGESVERVEILWEETLALEGRADYYDRAGALKDVLQNHMLQLLALVAMEPAAGEAEMHKRKLDVLASVRTAAESRRARYTAGKLADGREVRAYADEEGVDPARSTETFAEVALEVEAPRWRGTQFLLRAGKALATRRKLIRLSLRGGGVLEFGVDGPEEIVLRLVGALGGPVELRAPIPGDGLPAYAHVLLDVLGGTSALSVGGEEAEEAWRVVAPVIKSWENEVVPLEEYAAGSAGPS